MSNKQILSRIWLLDKSHTHRIYRTFLTSKKKSQTIGEKDGDCKKDLETDKVTLPGECKSNKPSIKSPKSYANVSLKQEPCEADPIPISCDLPLEKLEVECAYRAQREGFSLNFKKYFIILSCIIGSYFCYNFFNPKIEDVKIVERRKKRCLPARDTKIVKDPLTSEAIPSEIKYLLIGGGTATFSAFRAIKICDPKAKVLVVAKEPFNPYMRPPLSRELYYQDDREAACQLKYRMNGNERSLFFEPAEFFTPINSLEESEYGGISVVKGWEVKKLDAKSKEATLDDGKVIKFDKCLIATGGEPRNLPPLEAAKEDIKQKVTLYRGINDFKEIENLLENFDPKSVAIVGGGLLGSELSVALAKKGQAKNIKVTQIVRGPGPLARILPIYLSEYVGKWITAEGVELVAGVEVKDVKLEDEQLRLELSNGTSIAADHLIVAVGIKPNTDLAEGAGLEIDQERGGYQSNTQMLVSPDVYVAGDCASYCDDRFSQRRREEHHDNAVVTGRIAGENMTGRLTRYDTQPVFWSEIVNSTLVFEGIGTIDSNLPTVGVFAKPDPEDVSGDDEGYKKGVLFYLKNDYVVGILLVNLPNKTGIARQLLKEKVNYKDFNEVSKLFNIYEQEVKEASSASQLSQEN